MLKEVASAVQLKTINVSVLLWSHKDILSWTHAVDRTPRQRRHHMLRSDSHSKNKTDEGE